MNDAMDHHTRRKAHGESAVNYEEMHPSFYRTDASRVDFLRKRIDHIQNKANIEIAQIEVKIAEIEQSIANNAQ